MEEKRTGLGIEKLLKAIPLWVAGQQRRPLMLRTARMALTGSPCQSSNMLRARIRRWVFCQLPRASVAPQAYVATTNKLEGPSWTQ